MSDVTELLHSARRAVEAGDHHKALPLIEEAAKLGPNLFGVQLLRGICLNEIGYGTEAVQALRRAVELNPTSAQGHYNLGVALRSTRRAKEAERHFRQALRLQPGYEAPAVALRLLSAGKQQAPASDTARPAVGAGRAAAATAAAARPAEVAGTRHPNLEVPPSASEQGSGPRRAREAREVSPVAARPTVARRRRSRWMWAAIPVVIAIVGSALLAGRTRPGAEAGVVVWQAPGDFVALDFSPDGGILAAAGERVTLWRASTGVLYRDFTWGEKATDLAFSPSGTALAVSARDEKTGDSVKLWRMPDSGLVGVFPHYAGNRPIIYSPDGRLLAIGTDYMSAAAPLGVQLWGMPTRKIVGVVAKPSLVAPGYVSAIAFSPDGKLIASADDTGAILLSRTADRKKLNTIATGNMMAVALAFSPTSGLLAYGGSAGSRVTLLSVPDGRVVRVLQGEGKTRGRLGLAPAVNALAFTPDGRLLAICHGGGGHALIELFRVSDGELLGSADPARLVSSGERRPVEIRDLQFSRDGQYLAWCGSGGVIVTRVADLTGSRTVSAGAPAL